MCWVDKFSDVPQCKTFYLKKTTPNLPGILVGGTVQDQNRYKPICQLFNNTYRFATLYDTTNRIPVFSAYTFTGSPTDPRPSQSWMIEPQLEDEMEVENAAVTHQAADADYKNKNLTLVRGQLFPNSQASDNDTWISTFTLTNSVPQDSTFKDRWKTMEHNVKNIIETDCINNNGNIEAYVVTGAVPSDNSNNTLNNRVNIPDLLWTAYCCYNNKLRKWVARAHWGNNRNDSTVTPVNLEALEKVLKKKKSGHVQVFPKNCPRRHELPPTPTPYHQPLLPTTNPYPLPLTPTPYH
ncbi:endonuclease domain-containing 1 protein isoform X2 [Oncorhynchus kisutch]|uniref:Endonuclease domain-containing 1 protein n=1 Tax=Oncorhynchus kisutch TaxID=8019 RepID=A0A8C7DSN1_ONCKI|nr:endonuclease domain-containing 1 protein isoform X2 [Oncorhynchus kisutch]XP_031647564.1 endonuclease domain-containing 1 protein isoform X2 [Oncorhynchus kisutch]XP_031647565.1 endonuclease domain-containing 1 protein isoform X2 [Oncorhynchus kisutch]XP_031647566.1 endonuclease domain-containing 1 protein isoform X2 [Oncorhynchus kisutch]